MLMSDFGGRSAEKPVARYVVTTPEEPKEYYDFDVTSERLAADINAYFNRRFKELEITKLETQPVSYRVIPMITCEHQQRRMVMGQ